MYSAKNISCSLLFYKYRPKIYWFWKKKNNIMFLPCHSVFFLVLFSFSPRVMLWASSSPSVSAWVGNDPLCRGECFITALIPGPRTPYHLLALSRGSTRRGDTFKSCQESQQKRRGPSKRAPLQSDSLKRVNTLSLLCLAHRLGNQLIGNCSINPERAASN